HCPYAIGIGARDRYSDAAQNPIGQSVGFQFFPGGSAVDGAVEAAPRTAAVQTPRGAPGLPQSCKKDVRIGGIEDHVDPAGFRVFVKHLLPALTSILRAENSAFFVIAKRMSEGSNEGDVRIFGIHREAADGMRVRKANELPGLACVDRLVDSVAAD